jgi:hypothetical protein
MNSLISFSLSGCGRGGRRRARCEGQTCDEAKRMQLNGGDEEHVQVTGALGAVRR